MEPLKSQLSYKKIKTPKLIEVELHSGLKVLREDKTYITDECIRCDWGYGEYCLDYMTAQSKSK